MKKSSKSLAVIVCLALMMSLLVFPVSAASSSGGNNTGTPSKDYPMVFIHGYLGWGEYDMLDKILPHMGMTTGDTATWLESQGYNVVKPALGPMCSAWDRACELYAELTGTRTDYGIAHSKKYGHERYGRDYTGRGLLEDYKWSATNKLNLFGHSFGGATERTFVDILSDGRKEEVEAAKAAGETVSPFFEGGKSDWVYSVTMLVAPSNGSDFCEANPFMREFITGLVHYVSSALEVTDFKGIYDPHLDHFHIYKEDNETIMQGVLRVLNSDYMDHHDNALDDLWVDRATWMNKELQLQPNIYYQLYYGCTTDIGKAIGDNIPNDRQWLLFRPMSANMGKLDTTTKGSFLDGFGDTLTTINVPAQRLGREWQPNDGMVNMVSGYCPFRLDDKGNRIYDKHTSYVEGMACEPGQWYIMPMQNMDHIGFAGGFFNENPDNVHQFYVRALNQIDKFGASSDANCPSKSLKDVSGSAWYHEEVDYVLTNGLMAGTGGSAFSPNSKLSRAMIAQILYAMAGKPSGGASRFSDVVKGSWYENAVNWCAANGIVAGFDDGTFRPNDDVTREQLATILMGYTVACHDNARNRQIHWSLDTFSDYSSVSGWAQNAVAWAAGKHLIAGRGGMVIDPGATATRAEVAQIITSYCMEIVNNPSVYY